jgi:hypothetical protein
VGKGVRRAGPRQTSRLPPRPRDTHGVPCSSGSSAPPRLHLFRCRRSGDCLIFTLPHLDSQVR